MRVLSIIRREGGDVSIRTLNRVFYVTSGVLASLLAIFSVLLFLEQRDLERTHNIRYDSYLLADELRQSSDDLTRLARTYVITGDSKFERIYWETLAIRNGELPRPQHYERMYWDRVLGDLQVNHDGARISLRTRMERLGFTSIELAKLEEAELNSNQLVQSERVAFNAMKGLFQDSTGQFNVKGAPDTELARRILFHQKYHESKAAIMRPVNEFYELLDARTGSGVADAEHRADLYIGAVLLLLGLVLTWLGFSYFIVRRKIANLERLEQDMRDIGAGTYTSPFDVDSRDEIGKLSRAFVALDQKVVERTRALEQEVIAHTKAEAELRAHEAQLSEAQRIAHVGSWEVDTVTGKVTWSDELWRIFGLNPREVGLSFEEFLGMVHPDDQQLVKSANEESKQAKTDFDQYFRIIQPNGAARVIRVSGRVIFDEHGQMVKVTGIDQDITEQKLIEEDLEKARDAALESTRLKSEFLANMSHEIRTPMNGVIGMTALLLDTELTAEQREFTETINSSADSLMIVINDILDFSKIEAGKLRFEKLDFDLLPAIEGPVELLAERAKAKGIEMASLIESDVPVALCGDAGRLRQVLTNLIGNAVKFTETGEVVVRVTRECDTETHATLRFAISDTGIGISAKAQRRLFQAFAQADGSTTRKYGGTGLGLAISKQLVELMGGEIGVESTPDAGSTFWFTAHLEKQPAATATSAPAKDSLRGKRVLIVDDNATNRKILVHQTISWGMIPAEVESGRRAFELLRAATGRGEPFDLAILDLMMPEMDGFEVARTIKADESIASVRLMMLTSYGEHGHGEQAREAGVAAYLSKPVRQAQLFDCLTSVMGQPSVSTGGAKPFPMDSAMLITKHTFSEANIMSDKRILVAEDNIVNQKVALRQLTKLGYVVDSVANGREALEAVERISYDLILMDCQMPLMDGYEATAALRARETDGRHISIIAMTAHALEGERAKCLAAGMDDYLSKPLKIGELEKVLANWLPVPAESTEEAITLNLEIDDSPPVDMKRLYQAMGDEPEELQEMLEMYLEQMEDNLKKLHAAITAGDASEIDLIAHNCSGVSANCGMTAVVAPLRELERMGREGQLTGAAERDAEVEREFRRIKVFLQEQLTQLV